MQSSIENLSAERRGECSVRTSDASGDDKSSGEKEPLNYILNRLTNDISFDLQCKFCMFDQYEQDNKIFSKYANKLVNEIN